MKLFLFSVFDRAAQAYGRPIYVTHSGIAIRSFTDEVNNSSSDLYAHPTDYELYSLGEFDDSNGSFVVHEPKLILQAEQVVQQSSLVD